MSNPLVTIGIPNYNYGDKIGDTLESVLNQDFSDFEVIVYDDASTDDSVNIIQRNFGAHVRLIQGRKNLGLGAARNSLIECANGKYIFFLDSDDLLADGALRGLTRNIEGYDAVMGMVTAFCEDPNKTPTRHQYINEIISQLKIKFDPYLLASLSVAWNRLMSIDFLKKKGIKFSKSRINEDIIFGYSFALSKPKLMFIDEVVVKIRQHSASLQALSQNFEKKMDAVVDTATELFDFTRRLDYRGYLKLHGSYLAYFLMRHSGNPTVFKYLVNEKHKFKGRDRLAVVLRLIANTNSLKWIAFL